MDEFHPLRVTFEPQGVAPTEMGSQGLADSPVLQPTSPIVPNLESNFASIRYRQWNRQQILRKLGLNNVAALTQYAIYQSLTRAWAAGCLLL
jgi:hypothetical protein